MKDIIEIGGKEIEMTSNAATPYFYSQIFGEDFFVNSQKVEEIGDGLSVDLFTKTGFVMAKQAAGLKFKQMIDLKPADYAEWLSEFDFMDVVNAVGEIASLCMSAAKTKSVPKK